MVRKGVVIPKSCRARVLKFRNERAQVFNNPTPQEAALRLKPKWPSKKIRKLLRRGTIPGQKVCGRWYVDLEWVEQEAERLKDEQEDESDPAFTPRRL